MKDQLIRRSDLALFDKGFCNSAGEKRSPEALRRTPVDAFDQHRKLRWRQRHRAARLRQARPEKVSAVDALGEQAQPRPIPKQDLQERGILAAEDEQMTRERILLKIFLRAAIWSTTPLCCRDFPADSLSKLSGKFFRRTGNPKRITGNFRGKSASVHFLTCLFRRFGGSQTPPALVRLNPRSRHQRTDIAHEALHLRARFGVCRDGS